MKGQNASLNLFGKGDFMPSHFNQFPSQFTADLIQGRKRLSFELAVVYPIPDLLFAWLVDRFQNTLSAFLKNFLSVRGARTAPIPIGIWRHIFKSSMAPNPPSVRMT
jgi:hypothetical protein